MDIWIKALTGFSIFSALLAEVLGPLVGWRPGPDGVLLVVLLTIAFVSPYLLES